MRKLVLTCLASGIFITSGLAQTLFTYGNNSVNKDEFLRVYQKNSANKKPDMSNAALKEYLDLYSLFRMKVTEAESQHLDTVQSVGKELDNYRRQLARTYLTDEQVTNKLYREAYDRMKEDVHIAHILVRCIQGSDTVAAYKKIDSIYHVLSADPSKFNEMAKLYSDDKDTKDKGGDIGYITALNIIYPIENAAYNTKPGTFSEPFHTQFGYHIVKVLDKRSAYGQIKVAQIMLSTPKSKMAEGIVESQRKRADSIITALKHGASFEDMVTKYSDDKFTNKEGGVMQQFGVGRMVPDFEKAAFALHKPGDLSAPVQTEYGIHIIKLIEKIPLQPYDSLQGQIKKKIENDYRSQVAREMFFEKVKKNNGFKEYPANFKELSASFEALPDTGKSGVVFNASDYKLMSKPVFVLGGKNYLQSDFVNYMSSITRGHLMGQRKNVVHELYTMYVSNVVNDFEEHKLAEENPDFKNLMEEYRNGILLFELMDRNVWGKASKDSAGLKAFYDEHKTKYKWEPGFKGSVYKFRDESSMKDGMAILQKKNSTDEDVVKRVNTESNAGGVSIRKGQFEFSRFKDVPQSELIQGKITKPVKNADGSYTVVKVTDVFNEPTQKSLDDARGYVVAEYQDYLEKKWNAEMRQKYPVKLNQDVFNSMVK